MSLKGDSTKTEYAHIREPMHYAHAQRGVSDLGKKIIIIEEDTHEHLYTNLS